MERSTAESWAEGGRGAFHTTHWTMVLEAACPDADGENEAFARLYLDYCPPLYGYVRRRGYSPQEAEDVVQSFFARLLEKQALGNLRRDGGRFRSFLLGAMENFLANLWDRDHAQKRGGGRATLSLDAEDGEARFQALAVASELTPESVFERQWVLTVLGKVMERLRAEEIGSGRGGLFEDLWPHLQGDRSGDPYAAIAARHQTTEGAIKVAVHRLRQRYGRHLREQIARTVSSPAEVDEELRHLIWVVGQ